MAILEPLLILLTLLALLAASYIRPARAGKPNPRSRSLLPTPYSLLPVLLGLLLPLMVLTKTTAIFLFPAIAWLLWARAGYRLRPFLRLSLPSAALATVIWLSYYLFVVRPHFLPDYHYLFNANGYTGLTPPTSSPSSPKPSPTASGSARSSIPSPSSPRSPSSSSVLAFCATRSSHLFSSGPAATQPSSPTTTTSSPGTTSSSRSPSLS